MTYIILPSKRELDQESIIENFSRFKASIIDLITKERQSKANMLEQKNYERDMIELKDVGVVRMETIEKDETKPADRQIDQTDQLNG